MIYVSGNNRSKKWHIATGNTALCTGAQLGGAWGYSTIDSEKQGQPRYVCHRCRNIIAKRKVREFGTDDYDARLWEKGEIDAIDAERAKETSRTIRTRKNQPDAPF